VDARELAANFGLRRDERGQRLAPSLEERDERLRIAFVAIQRGEAIGRDLRGRILLERGHQQTCCAMGVAERRRPHVRGFGQPVRGVPSIGRLAADALEEHRVALGVGFARGMSVSERLLVMRIVDEALHEPIDLGAIHCVASYTWGGPRAMRSTGKRSEI
jgi:hypothetical protein